MAKKIGAKIVLEGESEYKKAIKSINSEQRELASEMKLCTAQFADQQNSIEALTAKHEILQKQVEAQASKVEELATMQERAVDAQKEAEEAVQSLSQQYEDAVKALEEMEQAGTASEEALEEQRKTVEELGGQLNKANDYYDATTQAVNNWSTQLNNAQTDLVNLNNRLQENGQYLSEAQNSTNGVASSIDEMGNAVGDTAGKSSELSDVLIGTFAGGLLTGGIEGAIELVKDLATAIIDCANNVALYADDINTLSVQTGLATDTLQELTYMQDLIDVSVDTVTGAMRRNIKAMSEAQEGSKAYAEAYATLGVEVEDVNGHLRNSEDVFWDVIDALGAIDNQAERDAIAMQVFGKSAQTLNPLIKQGSEGYKKFAEEAHRAGYVLDSEVLDALNETNDAHDRMNLSIEALKNRIGTDFADELLSAYDGISSAAQFVSEHFETLEGMWEHLTLLATGGVGANMVLFDDFSKIINKIKGESEEATEATDESTAAYEEEAEAVAEAISQKVEYADKTVEISGLTQEQADKLTELQEAYDSAKESAESSLSSQIGLFEELGAKSDLSTEKMISNLESQADTLNQMNADLQSLSGRIDGDLLVSLQNMGVDGAGYIHQLANASDSELKALSDQFGAVQKAQDELSTTMATNATSLDEYVSTLTGGAEKVKGASANIAENTKIYDTNVIEANKKAGNENIQAVQEGMDEASEDVVDEAETICTAIINTVDEALPEDTFTSIGARISNALASGILAGKDAVVKAALEVANAAKEAANSATGEKADEEKAEGEAQETVDEAAAKGRTAQAMLQSFGAPTLAQTVQESVEAGLSNIEIHVSTSVEPDSKNLFKEVRSEAEVFKMTTGKEAFS